MARIDIAGFETVEMDLSRLSDRLQIRRVVEAGARAAAEDMAANTTGYRHVRSGQMLRAIAPTEYRETLGGGSMSVYPQGNDRKGTPNAVKMFVTNYGRGGVRKKVRMGDKFITGNYDATEQKVLAAMEEEMNRILGE